MLRSRDAAVVSFHLREAYAYFHCPWRRHFRLTLCFIPLPSLSETRESRLLKSSCDKSQQLSLEDSDAEF
ncbi:hypothetical protein ACRRTK_003714 [Alexandromys fortis]